MVLLLVTYLEQQQWERCTCLPANLLALVKQSSVASVV